MSRINLFNKKTIYEIYDFNLEMQTDFDENVCRATLISKEKTLGPRAVYYYVRINQCIPDNFNIQKYIKERLETEFINHLNNNVGVECLIKKGEIPIEIYRGIKKYEY